MRLICSIFLILCGLMILCYKCYAAGNLPSAREIFINMPESIFESTAEGLGEKDKQDLLNCGRSEFWEILQETPDTMIFSSLPFGEKTLGIRLFRNETDGSTFIATGTMDEPVCTVEFWKNDSLGRLVPVEGPAEPEVSEFFRKGRKLPTRVQATSLVCLDIGGIVARPVFWNKKGMLEIPLDYSIIFKWDNGKFEKIIQPVKK